MAESIGWDVIDPPMQFPSVISPSLYLVVSLKFTYFLAL